MSDEIPFVSFSNEELNQAPLAEKEYKCKCGQTHQVIIQEWLGFYRCGNGTYLYSVNGKNVTTASQRGDDEE